MPLPTFLLIGANKGGTTSLHHYLSQHPDVFMSPVKEPMFFIFEGKETPEDRPDQITRRKEIINNLEDYKQLFAGASHHSARGESSTAYLHNSQWAAERIKAHVPHAKIIAILRDPLQRALSNYRMYVDRGLESRSFEACVFAEFEATDLNRIPQGQQYLHLGLYARHVKTYLEVFPAGQARFFLYDDLIARPHELLAELFALIDVDASFLPKMGQRYNVSGKHEELTVLSTATRRRLVDFYRADVKKLEELLNVDLRHWLREPS